MVLLSGSVIAFTAEAEDFNLTRGAIGFLAIKGSQDDINFSIGGYFEPVWNATSITTNVTICVGYYCRAVIAVAPIQVSVSRISFGGRRVIKIIRKCPTDDYILTKVGDDQYYCINRTNFALLPIERELITLDPLRAAITLEEFEKIPLKRKVSNLLIVLTVNVIIITFITAIIIDQRRKRK